MAAGPSLDLDRELGIFKAVRAFWRSVVGEAPPPTSATAAEVQPLSGRLTAFASVLAARPVRIETTRGEGGIRGATLLLPAIFDVVSDVELNRSLLLLRVAIDATTIGRGVPSLSPSGSLREAGRSIETLSSELPRFRDVYREAGAMLLGCRERTEHPHDTVVRRLWAVEGLPTDLPDAPTALDGVLWGRVLQVVLPEGTPIVDGDGEPPPSSEATEQEAQDITDITVKTLGDEDEFELPLHAFEKVELLESFNGNIRQLDGDDDLDDHIEAMQEVDLSTMVRGGPRAHSLLRAEVGLEAAIPDVSDVTPDDHAVHYPEWDHARGAYRADWCAVFPTVLPDLPTTGAAAESLQRQRRSLRAVQDQLLRQRQRRRRQPRVVDGDALDMEAVLDAEVARRSGRSPSARVYSRQARHQRDVATTVLVDISLSADSWIDNRRVWDVTRDALWVYGEASHEAGDDLQILAFASHTRHRIRTYTVLDWHEPWPVGKRRLEHIRPQGYTRIGPAVRHATAELLDRGARARQLVLLSDCKPTDYDRYEGNHGLRDVRRALEEARATGITVFGLAVDDVAKHRLPSMFGPGSWSLLRSPEDLCGAVARLAAWRRL
jgi:nitric oxide reductase NorD protein